MIAKLHDMTPNMMMLDVYVRCLFPQKKKKIQQISNFNCMYNVHVDIRYDQGRPKEA